MRWATRVCAYHALVHGRVVPTRCKRVYFIDQVLAKARTPQARGLVLDFLSIGSLSRLEAQRSTFGSHPSVRYFFNVTEDDDADPTCSSSVSRRTFGRFRASAVGRTGARHHACKMMKCTSRSQRPSSYRRLDVCSETTHSRVNQGTDQVCSEYHATGLFDDH